MIYPYIAEPCHDSLMSEENLIKIFAIAISNRPFIASKYYPCNSNNGDRDTNPLLGLGFCHSPPHPVSGRHFESVFTFGIESC